MAPEDWKRINWTAGANVRDGEATCKCGGIVRGRFAFTRDGIVSRDPCPSCGGRIMQTANATGKLPGTRRGPPQPDWAKK